MNHNAKFPIMMPLKDLIISKGKKGSFIKNTHLKGLKKAYTNEITFHQKMLCV